jgi:hypothetical protein
MTADEIRRLKNKIDADVDKTRMDAVAGRDEATRVIGIMQNTHEILDDLDNRFEIETGLDETDIKFLFLAVALQLARQYILSNDKFRLTANEGDKLVGNFIPKNWQNILMDSVPYDAYGPEEMKTGLGGTTHRYRTLGHDPIMGWIFGTMNILSDSLTKYDVITSYSVRNMIIAEQIPTLQVFSKGIEQIQADKYNLPAAIVRQAIHFGTDYFTKQGLPLPFISTINNDFSKTLLKYNVDMWGITRGIAVATLINSMIAHVHMLFYDPERHSSQRLYEVKTRKILSYSNLVASSSNVIYVAVRSYLGDKKALTKLDVGGLLVTLWRLFNDIKFIRDVKKEFIFGSYRDMIMGDGTLEIS